MKNNIHKMNSFGSVHLVGKTIYKLMCHMNWVNQKPVDVAVMDANDDISNDDISNDGVSSDDF